MQIMWAIYIQIIYKLFSYLYIIFLEVSAEFILTICKLTIKK